MGVRGKAGCCMWASTEVGPCTMLGHGTTRKTHTHAIPQCKLARVQSPYRCRGFLEALATHGCSLNLSGSSFCNSFVEMLALGDWEGEMTLSLSLALPEGAPACSASGHRSSCLAGR